VILGTLFVLFQLRQMQMHRNLEISMRLFEWADGDRLRKAFRWIERESKLENYDKCRAKEARSSEATDYPQELTAFFEQVVFFVKKFVDLDVIGDRLGSHIVSNWEKLEPWIMVVREGKCDGKFGQHFQKLHKKDS
jgi:hypothetical protein